MFIMDLIRTLDNLDTADIPNKDVLKYLVQEYVNIANTTWYKHSKTIKISRRSKNWWNIECQTKLSLYSNSKSLADWKTFEGTVKKAKQILFDNKINKITLKNCKPWDLINWVKCKLPVSEALHQIFNSA